MTDPRFEYIRHQILLDYKTEKPNIIPKRQMTNPPHPTNSWEWDEASETGFVEWFHGPYGPYTFRSEWFHGDCEIGDEKTRKEAMIAWLHAAYVSGYKYASKEIKVNDLMTDPP